MTDLQEIENIIENEFGNYSYTVQQSDENVLFCSCRNWGVWELPDDCEDEEDYDWEELSEKSYDSLRQLISEIRANFPTFRIDFETGEKNYIDFRVKKD